MQGYWNTQTDEEVLKTLRINELTFIGKFKKYEKVSLFENIRNLDYSPVLNLKSNLDDRNFVKVQIINKTTFDLQTDLYYKITAQIIPQKIRKLHNSEFLLEFNKNSIFEIYNPNEQEFTELIFKKYSEANTSNSQDILRSVKTITYQINKRNETFIYELLQNADDYPVYRNKVTVDFYITDKYLLFTHSGAEFRFNNVYSLCAVNAEDKVDEKDKIGFKGIGFKSVFKANEFVYLKSGKYSFRFDKAFHHAEYPWQLMPVYTKQEDLEISLKNNTRFLNSNVAIALKPRNSESVLLEYSKTLELFSDDRILLFLRNVEKVNVFLNNDKKIFCVKNDNKWWLKDFKVKVNQDVTEYLNKQINEGNEEIPSKFANLTSCKISFAASINDRQITLLNDAKLFNYLPLSINLNLPFLINSDFIPDGEREGLTSNEWNEFLLKEAGIQFVNFIVSTISDPKREKKFCYSILRLIPLFNEISDTLKNNEKWNSYFEFFKEGFQSSILGNNAKSFIPNEKGILVPLSNTLIDETGVADFLQEEFSQLTSITQELIHKEVGEGIGKVKSLINEYKEGKIYTVKNLKTDLQSPKFQEWLKIPTNNFKLIQYLSTNTDLAELLKTEKIILSETNQLSKAELLFNQIPKELTFITAEVINKELLALLEKHEISLSLKSFDAVKFYTENLLGKQNIINASLKDELSLLNFWRFIFDNWDLFEKEKTIKESLKNFQILCKSESENEFSKKLISEVYLSNDFNKENEIESILRNLEINDTSFISNKYIDEKRDADKWRKIFKQAAAKTDLQEVIATLIQKLPNIEGYKHFEIAKQVFRFWKENRDTANKLTDTQISLLKINLKIKCSDNEFRHASKCFISDYFNNNTLIASLLPQIELKSQITNDYGANITDGKKFFILLGCKELNSSQNVFDAKITTYIDLQDELREKHFEILKSISELHKFKKENGLFFGFENLLSKIKFLTNSQIWDLPKNIHSSSVYEPTLDLQQDELINGTIQFLNEEYQPNEIEKNFLFKIGINDTFSPIPHSSMKIKDIIEKDYLALLEDKDDYKSKVKEIRSTIKFGTGRCFFSTEIRDETTILNHWTIKHKSLLTRATYLPMFCEYILTNKPLLLNKTQLRIYANGKFLLKEQNNYILHLIKTNNTLINKNNEAKKPTKLFSYKLSEYINDDSLIPMEDLSEKFLDDENKISLEKVFGVKQKLSPQMCIELLKQKRLSLDEIKKLDIVDILYYYTPTSEDLDEIFLLNAKKEWRKISELFITNDEQFSIDKSQLLHEDFHEIANDFGIQELSEDNLVLKTEPEEPIKNDDILNFFQSKAKYIAFKIDESNFKDIESNIIKKINEFDFYEVSSLAKVFPLINSIYSQGIDFQVKTEIKVYYVDSWQSNIKVIDFLFKLIGSDKIKIKSFKNIIRWSENEIIEDLEKDNDIPNDWKKSKKKKESENDFLKEVEDFIESMNDIEDIYDADKIEDLKSILSDFKNQPHEKRNAFNLLAKLKLCKKLRLEYDSEWEFNILENSRDKYFIHSARGSFAYIHPNELLRMRDEGYKMAIDFGANLKIYNSPSEIIELYQSYLMLYQGNPSEEEIFKICEDTQYKKKFHFLILDKAKQTKDAMAILKILNDDNYE